MIHQYRNNGYNIVMDVYSGSVHVVDDVCYDVIAKLNGSETEPTAGTLKETDVKDQLLQSLGNKYEASDIEDALSAVIELTEGGQLFVKHCACTLHMTVTLPVNIASQKRESTTEDVHS